MSSSFAGYSARHLRHRRSGLNATGSRMGTHNQLLMDVMVDVMQVANLKHIQSARDLLSASTIQESVDCLVSRRVIPPSSRTTTEAAKAALAVMRRCEEMDNQALHKVLWKSLEGTLQCVLM